jgi:hypothetical protein
MSQIALIKKALVASARSSPPRTWAGTLVDAEERATQYLHLAAFPCEKCKGPVILGWMGTREDDIAKETEIKEAGAVCLSCGARPEPATRIDPLEVRHFRPVEWERTVEKKPDTIEPGSDPLPAELSQDADRS